MVLAAQQYATVFDAWPVAIRYERGDGPLRQVAWDWETTMTGELVGPGPLWTFCDDPGRAMQCPDYHGDTNFADPHTGYNYNTTYIGGEARFPGVGWSAVRRGTPPHACSRGSTCAMFGDGGRGGGTNKFMRAPSRREPGITLDEVYSGGQAYRHLGSTNVAFVDGHVSTRNDPRPGPHATDELLRLLDHPRNGFLSDDDRAYEPR
jgi:prepilin-type processing-associated H-X9-DG protein